MTRGIDRRFYPGVRHDDPGDELLTWADALEGVIAGSRHFDRVRVVRATASTQDAARDAAGGVPGLILATGRQTAGRGQRGRAWEQRGDLGVAVTFVVPAGDSERLSMAAGLAALGACEASLRGVAPMPVLGLKAPNDVIALDPSVASGRRKLAGVLIEQSGELAMIGVGINVGQGAEDFSEGLGATATSLRVVGSSAERIEVLVGVTRGLERWLGCVARETRARWAARVAAG